MSRILFAWELGRGYGHVGPFLPLAEALIALGHDLTFAARDVESATAVCGALPVRIVPAPFCLKRYEGFPGPPSSYTEILMRFGYADAPQLAGLLRAWRGLFDIVRTDVLVADHAPSALLAARGYPIARITFGNAFAVPPDLHPMPCFRPGLRPDPSRMAGADAAVLDIINRSTEPAGRVARIADIFNGATHLALGTPELDPYGARQNIGYLGLAHGHRGTESPQWPAGRGPRVLAYLRADYPHIDVVLEGLAASGARCVASVPGAPAELRRRHSARIAFSDSLVDIEKAVTECDAVVCHSGLGTVTAALGGGKPLLLVPLLLEQLLLARNAEALGAALIVDPDLERPDVGAPLRVLLSNPSFTAAAGAFAARWRARDVATAPSRAAAVIDRVARDGKVHA